MKNYFEILFESFQVKIIYNSCSIVFEKHFTNHLCRTRYENGKQVDYFMDKNNLLNIISSDNGQCNYIEKAILIYLQSVGTNIELECKGKLNKIIYNFKQEYLK